MKKEKIKKLVGNKMFTVVFEKKDGTLRKLNGRLKVTKHLKGGSKSYNDDDFNYITVYEVSKQQYRTVNCDKIKSFKFAGKDHA